MHACNIGPTSFEKPSSTISEITTLTLIIVSFILVTEYLSSITTTASITALVYAIPTLRDPNLEVQTVVSGLDRPTSMVFIGDDDILVLEKNKGTIQRVKNGVILPQPLLDVNVNSTSERGMLGVDIQQVNSPILPPTARLFNVFLYYTEAQSADGGKALGNRLYKYSFIDDPRLGPAMGRMFSPKLLLDLPVTPGPNHNGGNVIIGPEDNNVYTVNGDLNRFTQAQNFENGPTADGSGGILRLTQEGNPVGNGIIGSTHPLDKYFAYGIRNSFGLDFDPVTGNMWDTENGPTLNDEINLVEPGFNSGWRDLMGIAPADFDFNNLVSFGGTGHYRDPEFVWVDTVGPTKLKFYSSNVLGSEYQNDIFVADINHGRIYNFNLNPQRTALILPGVLSDKVADTDSETDAVIFGEGFSGLTDLKVGPADGFLYALSFGAGTIYRIVNN